MRALAHSFAQRFGLGLGLTLGLWTVLELGATIRYTLMSLVP